MEVEILPDKQKIKREFEGKAEDLIRSLDMRPDEVIVLKEERPIPIDEEIEDNERITIVKVSSLG